MYPVVRCSFLFFVSVSQTDSLGSEVASVVENKYYSLKIIQESGKVVMAGIFSCQWIAQEKNISFFKNIYYGIKN